MGGWFCVPHTKGRQRLIFDRRALNEQELQLPWVNLPHGTQFCKMFLNKHETVRGSGDDLNVYFYQLSHRPNWYHRNAAGRRITGQTAEALGGCPDKCYRMAIKVVAMGDRNGVAIAQAVHEALLQKHDCLKSSNIMMYNKHTPSSKLWELSSQGLPLPELPGCGSHL